MPGVRIVVASWVSCALFVFVAFPDLLGVDAFEDSAVGVSATLFLASLPVWIAALVLAVVRSARGDEIAVTSLFFLSGSAPVILRSHLLRAIAASVVVAAVTCAANPAAVLVPMLPLGLAGLWGARHGTFPARQDVPHAR
ncbi:MAG: hypothetical protein ACT4OX_03095 [Actinomycetota bacterium]